MNQMYTNRLQKVYTRMEEEGITCMLITPSPNMKYLTGCPVWADERLMAAVFAPDCQPFIVANKLYQAALAENPYQDILFWSDTEDPYKLLAQQIEQRGISTRVLAVDDALAAGILLPVLEQLSVRKTVLSSQVVAPLRLYKDAYEMQAMRTACAIASEALRITMEKGRSWIGHTENELASALCAELARQGIARCSASVSTRQNSADPHHISSNTVIEDNSCLWIDFGAVYQNYNSDMTRAFYFGEPDPEFQKLHAIVNEAREAGIAAAKVGAPLHAVDDAARGVIESYGYGEYFTHRTGHGIGIMNHEGPAAGAGEMTPIAPGMAFSVEPGIYLPGRFGVRVEDQVLIDENGNTTCLHDYPTDLVVFRK